MDKPLQLNLPRHAQAKAYEQWITGATRTAGDLTPVEMFVYRTQSADIETVKPILLWLFDVQRPLPMKPALEALAAVESWTMRRSLLRLASSDISRIVAALIAAHRSVPAEEIGQRVTEYLARQSRPGTYWPDDQELRTTLQAQPAYRVHRRGRLRMFLETVEDYHRGFTGDRPSKAGARLERNLMNIEHLLPQKWRSNWPVASLTQEIDRDAHVHRWGNLTLLTSSLNSQVSNGPWPGNGGKLAALLKHDVVLMNRDVRHATQWGEALIDSRGEVIIEALRQTWSVPSGHIGAPARVHDSTDNSVWVELRQVVAAGLLPVGTEVVGFNERIGQAVAVVSSAGGLLVNGRSFDSPSGAGKHVLGRSVNGWYFWRMPDGRRLHDIKIAYLQQQAVN